MGWLADRDYSLLLAGVTCKRVPAELQHDSGYSLARAFRLAVKLIDDIGIP